MGFRNNCYATVWNVYPWSDTSTSIKVTISKKMKDSGEYKVDFSGIVNCYGTDLAAKVAKLKEGERVKLDEVDVFSTYDKESKEVKTRFVCYKLTPLPAQEGNNEESDSHEVDSGEVDDGEISEGVVPF